MCQNDETGARINHGKKYASIIYSKEELRGVLGRCVTGNDFKKLYFSPCIFV